MLPVNNGNPCQVVDNIHSIFNDTMQKHTPLQPLSRNRRKLLNKPWITQALYKCIKEKNKIYRSLVKNGFENKVKFAYYKRYRNQLAHLLVLSKKEYYQSQFLIARNDSAKTWKLINTLLPGRTKATSTPPNLTHPLSGECKQNPADIANILNDFFVSVGKNMASKIIPPQSNKTHIAKMNCESSFYLHETSAEEIMHIIDTLAEKKGTRQNDIPVKILKLCSELLSSFLAKLFNNCINQGIYPQNFKCAQVTPIHKSGPENVCTNYRPLSSKFW